jgi:hypothetical protein
MGERAGSSGLCGHDAMVCLANSLDCNRHFVTEERIIVYQIGENNKKMVKTLAEKAEVFSIEKIGVSS